MSTQYADCSDIFSHSCRYFHTLFLHSAMKGSMPYCSIWGLPSRPRYFSTSSSTGRPWVSQPALRSTLFPFMVW